MIPGSYQVVNPSQFWPLSEPASKKHLCLEFLPRQVLLPELLTADIIFTVVNSTTYF